MTGWRLGVIAARPKNKQKTVIDPALAGAYPQRNPPRPTYTKIRSLSRRR